MQPPPLRAAKDYAAHEELDAPACLLRPSVPLSVFSAPAAAKASSCWGPSEHRIDAFQLRNEASFINDFREDVTRPDAAARSRRRPNCAVVTVIINGSVHALLWATRGIDEGREVLLDYGEQYWQSWHSEPAQSDAELVAIQPESNAADRGEGSSSSSEDMDAMLREMEAHEAVEDRHTAWTLVNGDKDGWQWADGAKPPPAPTLPIEPSTCVTSVSAVQPRSAQDASAGSGAGEDEDEDEGEVIFPACLFRSTTAEHRKDLLAAVKAWLRAGGGPQAVVMGRLLSTTHPAVAAAAQYARTKEGVASVQLGLFTRKAVARYQILCEYQGVRLTSPVGCSPWRTAVPAGRTSYMLALATVAHWGGMRQALRTLPRLRVPHVGEAAAMLEQRSAQAFLWADHSESLLQWCDDLALTSDSTDGDGAETNREGKETERMTRTQIHLIYSEHNPSKLPILNDLIDKYGARYLLRKVKAKYLSLDQGDSSSGEENEDSENVDQQRVDGVQAARRRRTWLAQLLGFIASPDNMREAVVAMLPTLPDDSDTDDEGDEEEEAEVLKNEAVLARIARMRERTDACASYDVAIAKERASFAWCESSIAFPASRF